MDESTRLGATGLGSLALGAMVGWFTADPVLGLDLQGGVQVSVTGVMDQPGAIERVRRTALRLGDDVEVFISGPDRVTVQAEGATAEDVEPLRILEEASTFEVRAGPGSADGERILGTADLESVGTVDAGSFGSAIRIDLTEEGGRKLASWTRDHVGQQVALVLDGEVLMAPTIQEEIREGALILTVPDQHPSEAVLLADRIAAAGTPLEVEVAEVGSTLPVGWLVLPALRAVALGALAAIAFGALKQRIEGLAAGAGLLATALGIGWVAWIGGTLTSAAVLGGTVGWLAGAVVLAGGRTGSAKARAIAAWPAWLAIAVAAAGMVVLNVSLPGFWRGVSQTGLPSAFAAALTGALGLLAVVRADGGRAAPKVPPAAGS